METILQSILDVAGVSAAVVFDAAGRLVCHRGHSVYDRGLCEQLSGTLVKAVDTIQLQQEDWDSILAQYADGKLLLRNLGAGGGSAHVLAVIADATLNPSFATVAIRVAANKLRKALEGGSASQPGASAASGSSPPPAAISPAPADSRPVLANTGVSWSKAGSSVGLSRITVADPASGAFLSRCAKELAQHVGPMAKVYVEEAVRRVSPDAPFSLAAAGRLLEDLSGQIEDGDDRAQFRKALAKG
jgi:hypothetical protein